MAAYLQQNWLHFPADLARIGSPPPLIFIMRLEIYTGADKLGGMIDLLLPSAVCVRTANHRQRDTARHQNRLRSNARRRLSRAGLAAASTQIDRPISRLTDPESKFPSRPRPDRKRAALDELEIPPIESICMQNISPSSPENSDQTGGGGRRPGLRSSSAAPVAGGPQHHSALVKTLGRLFLLMTLYLSIGL